MQIQEKLSKIKAKLFADNTRPIAILGIAILLVILLNIFEKSPKPGKGKETSWPIKIISADKSTQIANAIVYGKIESRQETTLRAAVDGYIQATPGKEGLFVKQNQELIIINPIDAELNLQTKEAEVKRKQAELEQLKTRSKADLATVTDQKKLIELLTKSVEREEKLEQRSLSSKARIEEALQAAVREQIALIQRQLEVDTFNNRLLQAQALLDSAIASRDQAKLDLMRTTVIAPFSGIISDIMVAIGDRVQPNQSLVSMYDTAQLEIRAQVPPQVIPVVQAILNSGQKINANIASLKEPLSIQLDRLAGQIEQNQGGIDAIFTIKEDNPPLRFGQTVKLIIDYPPQNDLTMVPQASLYDTSQGFIIYRVNNENRLESVPVTIIGEKINDDFEAKVLIHSDKINKNDKILTTRLPYARDNLKVEIINEPK